MAIPKRRYAVSAKKAGGAVFVVWADKLKLALKLFPPGTFKPGTKFSYKVFEGGNSVECEVTKTGVGGRVVQFRERGK